MEGSTKTAINADDDFDSPEGSSTGIYTIYFDNPNDPDNRYVFEAEYDPESKKYYVIKWPSKHQGKEVSEENKVELGEITTKNFETLHSAFEKLRIQDETGEYERIDPAGENAGYPVIIANNRSSIPVSELLFGKHDPSEPESDFVKGVKSAIPEGHAGVIVIEPRTRSPKFINFGAWSVEQGGNPNCQKINSDSWLSSALEAVTGAASISVGGTIDVQNLGMPVEMVRNVNSKGDVFYDFKDHDEVYADLFARAGWDVSQLDIVTIPNCKYNALTLAKANAQASDCHIYNLIPNAPGQQATGLIQQALQAISGKPGSIVPGTGDNCSSFAYKMVLSAKTGKMPSSVPKRAEFPKYIVGYVAKQFASLALR